MKLPNAMHRPTAQQSIREKNEKVTQDI